MFSPALLCHVPYTHHFCWPLLGPLQCLCKLIGIIAPDKNLFQYESMMTSDILVVNEPQQYFLTTRATETFHQGFALIC